MARVLRNRVYETSTTTGTGAITLDGAYAAGFNTFYEAGELIVGDTFPYVITDSLASPTWYEAGEGTLLTTTTFSRDVEDSTNNNALIDLPAGTHIVFLSPLASWLSSLVTSADVSSAITSALADYYTADETDTAISVQLMPYAQTAAVTAALNALSASIAADYLTIASAAATYATPASVTTQINTALTPYVTLIGTQTLTNKTLTTPTIGDYSNATHTHLDAAGGGQLNASNVFNAGVVSPVYGGMGADTSSLTGIYKFSAGVPSLAVAGTDYTTPTGTQNLSNKTITASTLNSTPIGASSRSTLAATTGDFNGTLTADTTKNDNTNTASHSISLTGRPVSNTSSSQYKNTYSVTVDADFDWGYAFNLYQVLVNGGAGGGQQAMGLDNLVWLQGDYSGTLGEVIGQRSRIVVQGGSIGSAYGSYISGVSVSGGSVSNNYGLRIGDQTAGSFNWALRTGAGLVQFGDNTTISGTLSTTGALSIANTGAFTASDTATGVTNVLTLGHNTSGIVAANFGTGILLTGESSTTDNQNMATIDALWGTETHASRAAALTLNVYSTSTKQEGLRILADSGGVKWGWGATTPVARQTITGSRGGNAALADLLTKLALTGYIIDSTTA